MSDSDIGKITPVRFTKAVDGGVLAGWRWGHAGKPPLLFCHATGFCASAYKQMLQELSADYDIFAIDLRGHGRTQLPADPRRLRSWRVYGRDIASFLDRTTRKDWTLTGHSMGAVTAAIAADGHGDIGALKLIEPVAMHPLYAQAAKTFVWGLFARRAPLVQNAAKRRAFWPSGEMAAASYARKEIFRNWADGVLADYLEDGLKAVRNGVRLACDPAWEAATFAAQAHDFWAAVRRAPAPISVMAANHQGSTAPASARMRFRRYGAAVAGVDGVSHLAPMENPALAAKFIRDGLISA